MSRQAERLRRGFDALWQREDWEAAFRALEPDFEWTPPPGWPESGEGPFTGREEFERTFRDFLETWEDFETTYEITDLDDGRVIVETTISGRGRGSGATVAWPSAQIWEFEGDRPVRMRWYRTREEALADRPAQ